MNKSALQGALDSKTEGNQHFSNGHHNLAISSYENAIAAISNKRNEPISTDDETKELLGVLFLNKAQALLASKTSSKESFEDALGSTEHAIAVLSEVNSLIYGKYREKALYRRAMSHWNLCQLEIEDKNDRNVIMKHLNASASDIMELMHHNPKNGSASALLKKVRLVASRMKDDRLALKSIGSSSEEEIANSLQGILRREEYGTISLDLLFEILEKFPSRLSDTTKLTFTLLLHHPHLNKIARDHIITLLLHCPSFDEDNDSKSLIDIYFLTLAKVVEAASPKQAFIEERLDDILAQPDKKLISVNVDDDIQYIPNEDTVPHKMIHQKLCDTLRIALHKERITEGKSAPFLKAILDFILIWIGTNRVTPIGKGDEVLSKKEESRDKNSLSPKEFARVNKIEYLYREFMNARKKYIANLVPITLLLQSDSSEISPILTSVLQINGDVIKTTDGLTNKIQLVKLAAAAFMCDEKIGSKVYRRVSEDAIAEFLFGDTIENQILVSQLIYNMANCKDGRSLLTTLFVGRNQQNVIKYLQNTNSSVVRSNLTLSLAKLNLASEVNSQEDELFETACSLLIGSEGTKANIPSGLELLHYLSARPQYKSWICADTRLLRSLSNIMEELGDNCNEGSFLYSYFQIIHNLVISVTTLEREKVSESGNMDYESYLQLKKLNKMQNGNKGSRETKDEVEDDDDDEAEIFDKEVDVNERIVTLVNSDCCSGLVDVILRVLREKSSDERSMTDQAQELGYLILLRMSTNLSTRGRLIQVGVLKHCVTLALTKKGQKKILSDRSIDIARHVIAKLLVSTNPLILPASQKLSAVPHLLSILNETTGNSNQLPVFEALLALTNLAGDEACQDKIGKQLNKIHYQIFSDHLMVRQAAIECISNLACTRYVYSYFTGGELDNGIAGPTEQRQDYADNLKLWCALALDVENINISRASLGGLAMCTSVFEDVCVEISKLDSFDEFIDLGHYSHLELMHRALVVLSNILRIETLRQSSRCSDSLSRQVHFCVGYAVQFTKALNEGNYSNSREEEKMVEVTIKLAREIVSDYA